MGQVRQGPLSAKIVSQYEGHERVLAKTYRGYGDVNEFSIPDFWERVAAAVEKLTKAGGK